MSTISVVHNFDCSQFRLFTISIVHDFDCSRFRLFTISIVRDFDCSRFRLFTNSIVQDFECPRFSALVNETWRLLESNRLEIETKGTRELRERFRQIESKCVWDIQCPRQSWVFMNFSKHSAPTFSFIISYLKRKVHGMKSHKLFLVCCNHIWT